MECFVDAEKTNIESSSHAFEDTVSVGVDEHTSNDPTAYPLVNEFDLAVTEKDDHDLDNLFDVLDTMSWNNEVDNSIPIHSSYESDDISLDDLLAFDFDWNL